MNKLTYVKYCHSHLDFKKVEYKILNGQNSCSELQNSPTRGQRRLSEEHLQRIRLQIQGK